MDSYIQKYQVNGGYKLRANIMWPEKDPETGKTIRKHIGIKLDCWEHETMKAYVKLGEIIASLKKGIHPNAIKTKIKKLKPKFTNGDLKDIWEVNILPWFGEYAIAEINPKLLGRYIEKRWPLRADGELQGKHSTYKKHMRALRTAVLTVAQDWKVPAVKFKEIPKSRKHPLPLKDAITAAPFVKAQSARNGEKYLLCHWIMLYTAMDISDALSLAPDDITSIEIKGRKRRWISMERGKSGVRIELPFTPQLRRILGKAPRPIDPKVPYCHEITAKNVATAIRRAFAASGRPGYSSKDLRRMLGAILTDLGYPKEVIRKGLTHAPDSNSTDAYMGVYDSTLDEAFDRAFGG